MFENLKGLWATVKEICDEIQAERIQRKKQRVLFNLALAFNMLHTFTTNPVNGNRWMCPRCNEVHRPIGSMQVMGSIFPDCCGIQPGHRQNKEHATDPSFKLDWEKM